LMIEATPPVKLGKKRAGGGILSLFHTLSGGEEGRSRRGEKRLFRRSSLGNLREKVRNR